MEFNYNAELMKFKAWQEEQERILSEAGMSKKDIKMIKDKDWEVFKGERTFCIHNISLESTIPQNNEGDDCESDKYRDKQVYRRSYNDSHFKDSKEDWLENIEDERLYNSLKSLTPNQLDLAYSVYECRMTLSDYAIREGVSLANVSKMHKKIIKKIKKIY
jgi:DNA-directed RNA polymerase specialized sigma subunit